MAEVMAELGPTGASGQSGWEDRKGSMVDTLRILAFSDLHDQGFIEVSRFLAKMIFGDPSHATPRTSQV
jgi:hypothetical protein